MLSIPTLYLLFPLNGNQSGLRHLIVYQLVHLVFGGKALGVSIRLMLINPADQMIGHACVNRSSGVVGKYVDVVLHAGLSLGCNKENGLPRQRARSLRNDALFEITHRERIATPVCELARNDATK